MYPVTNTFIENSRKLGRQFNVRLSWDSVVLESDSVQKLEKEFNGDFHRTVMQSVSGEIVGRHDLTDKTIQAEVGISFRNSPFEYVNYGQFLVKEHERIVGTSPEYDRTTFKAYDAMLNAHALYDVNELGITYPISVFNLFVAIANYMGLSVSNSNIVNGEKMITEDKWTNIEDVTYRNILDEIAAASNGTIMVRNGQLYAKNVDTSINVSTIPTSLKIYEDTMKSLALKEKFKSVNILNLTREQLHDNYVYPQDFENIPINERSEIVIADNQIMDKGREVFVVDLYNSIVGLSYYPFKSSAYGMLHLEPMDVVNVVDMENQDHISVVTNSRLVFTSGIKEEIESVIPSTSKEQYALVTDVKRNFMKVYALVDQQNGKIELSVQELKQEIKDIEVGGSNLLINGSGELKNFTYWTFYPTNARLMFHKSLLYRKALTNYTIFDIVTNENSLSGNNLSFFANGKALNGLFRTYPNNEYGFRFKRVFGNQDFNIEIHEFNENKGYIGKRVYTFDNTEVYGTISNITFGSETSFFALLYDVQADFSNRLVLTEMMFNVGNPKTYEKNPDVLEESIRTEVLNRITRVETEAISRIEVNTEAISLEKYERETQYGTLNNTVSEQGTSLDILKNQVVLTIEERLTDAEGEVEKISKSVSTVESTQETFTTKITDLEGKMTEQQAFFRTGIDGLAIGGTNWETTLNADGEKISFLSRTGSVQAHFGANGMYVNRWETDFHSIEKFEERNVQGTIHKNRRSGA